MHNIRKILIAAVVSFAALPLTAQIKKDTIEVTTLYTTYIRFPIELLTAERSDNENIMGEIVPESKNIVRLRASRPFTRTSNITVIDSKGFLHTYYIKYCEHPATTYYDKSGTQESQESTYPAGAYPEDESVQPQPGKAQESTRKSAGRESRKEASNKVSRLRKGDAPNLKDIIEQKQTIYHLSVKKDKMTLTCENIFTYSDMLYIVLRIDNNSGVSYESEGATFTLSTMGKRKKIPIATTNIYPKARYGSLTVAPGESGRIAYSLDKLTLSPTQVLQISIPERNGSREFMMTLIPEDINESPSPI